MKLRRSAAAIAAIATLTLASCSGDGDDQAGPTPPATETTQADSPDELHALGDTVTIGDTLTISDAEIITEGCEFSDTPTRDAVKFQILATVNNETGQDIVQALWPSDMRFTDPDGLSVIPRDIAAGEPPCSNDHPTGFVDLADGETRRAAVTLEAPAGATEMVYSTDMIQGAEPVRWDVSEEIEGMEVTSSTPAPQPDVAEEPAGAEATARDYRCPQTDNYVTDPSECETPVAVTDIAPDPATVPFADGGTCPAYKCGYGHDENGNPNPSSGEIQGWWMDCIAINDESYCRENDPYS